MSEATEALAPGVQVGKYVVEETLGRGAVAVVYRVRHRILGTTHALKVLAVSSPSLRSRLIREGRVQARLRHPNVVPVTDVVEALGAPGLLADHVAGPTLEEWLRTASLELGPRLALFRGIAAGVSAAHAAGVVHRDLKPSNVLLASTAEGLCPRVNDFGIARVVEGGGGPVQTRAETMMGTPAYMAPEQFKDAAKADARADIFSLGCILYELVTGRRTFPQQDLIGIAYAVDAGDFVPPRELRPELPPGVVAAIHAALRPAIEDRPRSVGEMVALLDAADAELPAGVAATVDTSSPLIAPVHAGAPTAAPETLGTFSFDDAEPEASAGGKATSRRVLVFGVGLALLFLLAGGAGWWLSRTGAAVPGPAAVTDVPGPTLAPPEAAATAGDGGSTLPSDPDEVPAGPAPRDRDPGQQTEPVPPVPEAEPPPEAEPTPAVEATPAPAPSAPARGDGGEVHFVGGASAVVLVDAGGARHAPGAVPTGKYRVMAEFTAGSPVHAGDVVVEPGSVASLRCIASFQQCRVEAP